MNPEPQQQVRWHACADASTLQTGAVQRIRNAASTAISARGVFRIVLAGGNTPRGVYQSLRALITDWSKWQVYFGDERCLPIEDSERNSRMVRDTLLDHVRVPRANVHAIPAERGAQAGADAYAQILQAVGDFDLVLLGLGEDGHTASLFPGHDWGVGDDAADTLAIFDAPKPPPERVSLTATRLSRSRAILFLVDGESKRDAVSKWRTGENIPATSVAPRAGVDVLVQTDLLR